MDRQDRRVHPDARARVREVSSRPATALARRHRDERSPKIISTSCRAPWGTDGCSAAERHLFEHFPESHRARLARAVQAMHALGEQTNLEKAWALTQRAIAIGAEHNDRDLQMLALQDSGRILVSQGRVAEGMAAIDEAMAAATSGQLGPRTSGRVFCNMMSTCEKLADYRARERMERGVRGLVRAARALGLSGHLPGASRAAAAAARLVGRRPRSEARSASEELEDFVSDVRLARVLRARRDSPLRMGDLARPTVSSVARTSSGAIRCRGSPCCASRRERSRAHARSSIARCPTRTLAVSIARGSCLRRRRSRSRAVRADRRARRPTSSRRSRRRTDRRRSSRARRLRAGSWSSATESPCGPPRIFRRAWKLSKDSDLPYEAARARVMLAQAYRACGNTEDAELELQAAAAGFERLGAASAARSTAELLETF